jgi:hypothetical protein
MLHHEARMPMTSPRPKKLILVELNEITWRFVDPLIKEGALPNFARLIRQGTRGTPIADEQGADLDPWVSWTTVYTGRKAADHGVRFLEQPPETKNVPAISAEVFNRVRDCMEPSYRGRPLLASRSG